MDYKIAVKNRRSYYAIGNSEIISQNQIIEIVEYALKHTPSAFNCQSQTAVVLFGKHHLKLWEIVMNTLQKIILPANFAKTAAKINSFAAGFGTVLFFNNDSITQTLQNDFPTYKDNFPVWAEQANGMLQMNVWNMLEIEKLGASLQHYNPLISEEVCVTFDLPKSWRLIAQMPFGNIVADPADKEFDDLTARIRVFQEDKPTERKMERTHCSPETDDCMHLNIEDSEDEYVDYAKKQPDGHEDIACSQEFYGCIGNAKE